MPRITPLSPEQLPAELRPLLEQITGQMGFTPNDALLMAHHPAMFKAVTQLVDVIYMQEGALPRELKQLAALAGSRRAGCRYCSSHAICGALQLGVGQDKLAVLDDYARSPLFSAAERAVLDLARAAAGASGSVNQEHFFELERHFSPLQIIELVGVISLFGFLNRWNTTLETCVEETVAAAVQGAGVSLTEEQRD